MSVMIADQSTILNIVRTLCSTDYTGNGGKFTLYSTAYALGWEELEKLGRRLWIANHKSYRVRYRTNKSGFYKYGGHGKILSQFQLLKSLHFVVYQCDEDFNCLEKWESITRELERVILANLPEYQSAEWN